MDFNYKNYSLQRLEEWVHDSLSNSETSPQEIYNVIKGVVEEQYDYFKFNANRCYELLALLNGNGKGHIKDYDQYVDKKENLICDKDDPSPECKGAWDDFWEAAQYTEEELNAMCDKAESDDSKEKCREYNLREAEYYNKRVELDAKQDKIKKWQLPVEVDGLTGEYFLNFPDDLLEASNLKEGDQIEWIGQDNGSYILKKVDKKKTLSYDEMIAKGWTMTGDGFWIRENDETNYEEK